MNSRDRLPETSERDDGVDGERRSLFALAAVAPLVLLGLGARAAGAAAPAPAPACYDPNALPAAQKSMRRTLNFKAESTDPKKKCGLCSFYKPPTANCGKCDLLTGGAVAAASVCDSFAPRA